MKTVLKFALAIALALSFTQVEAAQTINGAGATFPYPVYSAWAFDYNKVTGVQLNYQSIGSGRLKTAFCGQVGCGREYYCCLDNHHPCLRTARMDNLQRGDVPSIISTAHFSFFSFSRIM